MSTFTVWRQPMTIQEINTEIDKRWPSLINFNLRTELEHMAQGYPTYWSEFAPKWEIADMCLKAGLIQWLPEQHGKRHFGITPAGRAALDGQS